MSHNKKSAPKEVNNLLKLAIFAGRHPWNGEQTFYTPYLQSPPPAVFHDKHQLEIQKTQQENLLGGVGAPPILLKKQVF